MTPHDSARGIGGERSSGRGLWAVEAYEEEDTCMSYEEDT
jgi:CRISPR/Cas system CSM-associated protein Csm4 (group 5 of RAMP superfamily)